MLGSGVWPRYENDELAEGEGETALGGLRFAPSVEVVGSCEAEEDRGMAREEGPADRLREYRFEGAGGGRVREVEVEGDEAILCMMLVFPAGSYREYGVVLRGRMTDEGRGIRLGVEGRSRTAEDASENAGDTGRASVYDCDTDEVIDSLDDGLSPIDEFRPFRLACGVPPPPVDPTSDGLPLPSADCVRISRSSSVLFVEGFHRGRSAREAFTGVGMGEMALLGIVRAEAPTLAERAEVLRR